MKCPPGVLPPRFYRCDDDIDERCSDPLDLALLDIENEREGVALLLFLEAVRNEIERDGPCDLRLVERNAERGPNEAVAHPSPQPVIAAPVPAQAGP